jgi:hypothetical protein
MLRLSRRTLIGLVMSSVLVGCGSSGSGSLTKSQAIARIDQICQQGGARVARFLTGMGNPTQDQLLTQLHAYDVVARTAVQRELSAIANLNLPPALRSGVAAAINATRRGEAMVLSLPPTPRTLHMLGTGSGRGLSELSQADVRWASLGVSANCTPR